MTNESQPDQETLEINSSQHASADRNVLSAAFHPPEDDDVETDERAPLYQNTRQSMDTEPDTIDSVNHPSAENAPSADQSRHSPQAASSSTSRQPRTHYVDSVFSNLSAKPSAQPEKENEEPPTYEEVAADIAPPYWDTTMIIPNFGTNEIYIDGMTVGSPIAFFWSALVSFLFPFVGFLVTYVLSATHSGRYGSQVGLSMTLLQRGYNMVVESGMLQNDDNDNSYDFDELPHQKFIGCILLITGWCLFLIDTINFIRVRRTKNAIQQTNPENLAAEAIV
ncbi:heavy metal ion homeostasis protein [Schizosaccharomyces cryophilus OY26]|uniref:Heavy metal ion homeostasis protein n=1 Tax=Schizosaccharomyces cryophilus (strain OY26 / ATCC MYA-4695 / CBS 11777 / NBRC 106824 / NRRL Y48691) TaxID=653667 RepID=S9X6L4_SCHCR|nr:heavy metal ion homeostasis protein [Schizosaccharomyces cryophilus OY26]EPY52737.1 heavy metal ion homeostasis protein [Schizosaccharomyces cryophilus OY26]